jgi:hypothetical protein
MLEKRYRRLQNALVVSGARGVGGWWETVSACCSLESGGQCNACCSAMPCCDRSGGGSGQSNGCQKEGSAGGAGGVRAVGCLAQYTTAIP